ncbi:hypothetical protein MKW94_020929 [Papaver nudicaule]|uniref:F-box/LRR-repeat protein 15/At3g58940/PEG3-like LRR domain-containing protein n=1 Tax=Papaver nudicaule TaxID=74823 RepID=A0AA41VZI8_PAPNU|nr:hypothetical protein [Papaver nudicaule]
MSLSSNGNSNKGLGKRFFSKAVQAQGSNETSDDDYRPCKIRRTSSSGITSLPDDCICNIYKCLRNRADRNSFGLTCHQWLHIQNTNEQSLWHGYPKIASTFCPESYPMVLCKLWTRFQHFKYLCLRGCPKVTDFVASKLLFSRSEVHTLDLDFCTEYSDIELSSIFSWFPGLKDISLAETSITDIALEALVKCCPSLEKVDLSWCKSITDSGISFLLRNCHKLGTLRINFCSNVTGSGFLGCPKTLTSVVANRYYLKQEGINAMVSGGGLEHLRFSTSSEFADYEEESINTEAVITISKGCPLLRELALQNCDEVELEGWEAIGLNCKNLESLDLFGASRSLCDLGLIALSNGCDKLSELSFCDDHRCSSSALELFKHERPNVDVIIKQYIDD